MYFIEKEEDLISKEIVFTHFARFADAMVIVTKDKGIFVFDKDEEGIIKYREHQARKHILGSDYLRKELNSLGIITNQEIEKYQQELKEKWKKEKELREKQQEERDYKEYLRLKDKFKNENS